MNVPNHARRAPTVGYLAVLEDPQFGFTGGLLVVSASGRPLEFHCSTPLTVTRAQEILFGATLRAHLCGELIAAALLKTAKITPTVLLVQDRAATPPASAIPIMLLAPAIGAGDEAQWADGSQCAEGAQSANDHQPTPLAGFDDSATVGEIDELLASLVNHVELAEPFERVNEAIREAQRLSAQEGPASDAA